jgi:XapX domain-containing protein
MKIYLLSLAAGVLVGIIYSLLNIRSPAPPIVALIGLLGILIGEQLIPVGKQLLGGTAFNDACRQSMCGLHVMGMLPGRHAARIESPAKHSETR